jgi:hypothetical protein
MLLRSEFYSVGRKFKTSNIFYNGSYLIFILIVIAVLNLVLFLISKKRGGILIERFLNLFVFIFYIAFWEFNFYAYLNKVEIVDTIELVMIICFFIFSLGFIFYLNISIKKHYLVTEIE